MNRTFNVNVMANTNRSDSIQQEKNESNDDYEIGRSMNKKKQYSDESSSVISGYVTLHRQLQNKAMKLKQYKEYINILSLKSNMFSP